MKARREVILMSSEGFSRGYRMAVNVFLSEGGYGG